MSAPWDALGGVVDERVRWLARFVPASAVIVGCWVGSFARSAQGAGRVYLRGLRCWLGPPAVIVAGVLIVLRVAGREDAIGLVVAGFLGYWAGIDLGLAIWPRICGRSDPAIGPDRRDDRFDRWFPI